MKRKYILGILTFVMCFVLVGCGKVKTLTLNEIADKFNAHESVKQYKEYGYELKATVDGNKLVLTTKSGEVESSVTYNLNGNILSNEKLADEELMTLVILLDSIGQLRGYKSGELAENLNAFSEETKSYTLDKEGVEVNTSGETNSVKIDLSKKIPLKDMKDFYLKTDAFDMIKELVEEKSSGNQSGIVAKLAYDVAVGEEESTIYIGEKEELTDSAYKSILSALEVMYGKDVANKFKEVYPKFKDGKTTVDAFTVETNYKMEDIEESMFKGMKIVLVTIDNSKIK